MARYKWKSSPTAIRNLAILAVAVILLLWLMISCTASSIRQSKANKQYRKLAATVAVDREAYEMQNLTFPSGRVVNASTTPLPDVISEYIWFYYHQDLFPADSIRLAKGNPDYTHFLYRYGNDNYSTYAGEITLATAEASETVPHLYQYDPRWGFEEYFDTMIGLDGDGPTAVSMCLIALTGDTKLNPKVVAQYAIDNSLYYEGYGTAWALVPYCAEEYKLECKEVILDRYAMENELDQGNVMIIVLEGSPNYSTAHFLVLTGYDVQGFFVNDPVSPANSRVRWAYEDLEEYIVAIWSLSKE